MQSHATLNCPLNVYRLAGDQILPSNQFPGSKQDRALSGKPFYRPETFILKLSYCTLELCLTGEKKNIAMSLFWCAL